MKENFISYIENNYHLQKIDISKLFHSKHVYVWCITKEYNYFNINQKILDYRSAFGNIGYDIKGSSILKGKENINDHKIYFDILKVNNEIVFDKLFYSNFLYKNLFFLYGTKEIDLNILYNKLKSFINTYFNQDYINYTDEHKNILFSYLDEMLILEFKTILRITDLKGESYPISLSKDNNESYKINNEDLISFPFSKPYNETVSFKNILLEN